MNTIERSERVRVENLSTVETATYMSLRDEQELFRTARPFTILFVRPYQGNHWVAQAPSLGVLTLAAVLRERFGRKVRVIFRDMKLYNEPPEAVQTLLSAHNPDILAVSALNTEAAASYEIARLARNKKPDILTVIGGPFTMRQTPWIFSESYFDWAFEGAADRTFPRALARYLNDQLLGNDIPGFSYRATNTTTIYNHKQDLITDLDQIPMPAWDLHDFDTSREYKKRSIISNFHQRRFAYLFTSRGCPYLCNYCHDTFTKRFVYQSTKRVIAEISLLRKKYKVTEFHIVDDIFNLHKPRVQEIMRAISKNWPEGIHLAFPNGLRGDILDQPTIDAMVKGGTYHATISIETVTPRLQRLVEKDLDIERAKWAINEFSRQRVIVQGAFMYGFPTETPEELEATLDYAIKSPLLHAHFFSVVPQRGTPIHELAKAESETATSAITEQEAESGDYVSQMTWYQLAYGYPLRRRLMRAQLRFLFHPPRLLRYLIVYRHRTITLGLSKFLIDRAREIQMLIKNLLKYRSKGPPRDSTN